MGLLSPDDLFGPPTVKLIADTYEHTNLMWDKFLSKLYGDEALRSLLKHHDRERELVELVTGATIQKLSADRPQALTGYTVSLAVVDEAAFVKDESMEMLMPCLAVRQGTVIAFGTAESTPNSQWHKMWYIKGQDGDQFPDYWSVRYTSTDSPYFPPEELRVQQTLLDDRRFRQLYLAEWQLSDGSVFRNIDGCVLKDAPHHVDPVEGRPYVIGADLGRYNDYTVIYVADARTSRIVHQERWSNVEWMSQVERIDQLHKLYNGATVMADATAAGDVVVALLRDKGVDVVGIVMTPQMKERIIQKLVVTLEREEIRFPEYKELIQELNLMDTKSLPSGGVRLTAPVGYHDDCVIALALVNWGLQMGYSRVESLKVEEFGWQSI